MAISRLINLNHQGVVQAAWSMNALASAYRIDAASEQAAASFIAPATMTVTDVACYLNVTGTVTDATYTLEIQTDSSGAPSGTTVGAATTAFAGPAASGYLAEKALGSSASLTINTVYWLVLKLVTTGSTSASNYVVMSDLGSVFRPNQEKRAHHNGTSWDQNAAGVGVIVLKDNSGAYYGYPTTADVNRSAQTDIFGSNRQGMKFTAGAKTTLRGVGVRLQKSGTPNDLLITVYEGSTSKYTQTLAAASLSTNAYTVVWFTSPIQIASDTACYITFDQSAAGGTDANDYDIHTYAANSTFLGAALPTGVRFLAGTTADPTGLTVVTTEIPVIVPIIDDMAVDLDETAGAGTTYIFCGGE
jgi:hypothetical protein